MAVTAYASLGTITATALRATLFPEYVDTTLAEVTVSAVTPADVWQLQDVTPGDSDTKVAPGRPVTFTLLSSVRQRVEEFGATLPDDWELATTANGYTHSNWNSGSDNWTILPHEGGYVLRCAGRGFAINNGSTRAHPEAAAFDMVCRMRWYTGATAGLVAHCRFYDDYGKATQGPYQIAAVEIDSGGCRLVLYDGSYNRVVKQTDSFTPVNGTWYWLRLQIRGQNPCHYRGKYWGGERTDEPTAWSHTWQSETLDVKDERIKGNGLHVQSGTAWFDQWEMLGIPSDEDLARLTVTVNTIDHTLADGTVDIAPISYIDTWNSVSVTLPNEQNWHVRAYPRLAHDPNDIDQDAVITWDRPTTDITMLTWDWDVADFPNDAPTYDPTTDNAPGDPTRMSNFGSGSDAEIVPSGQKFEWLIQQWLHAQGYQYFRYNVASLTWPLVYEDFQWVMAHTLYGYTDGKYVIGHPVWREHAASIIPAELVFEDHKAEVIPKGSLQERFAASVVPQAYFRGEYKSTVTPALVRLWEGDASALVSVEILQELDASALVFMRREGTIVHFRVISSTTDAQLRAMGITFTARIYATTAEVIVSALPATVVDQSDIACSLAAVTVETYRLDWGTLVEAAVDSVAATGLQATIIGAQKAYATLGTVVVTGNDLPQIDTYVKWDADFWTVGDQFEVVMDRYLGRWYNESGTGHDFDIYTYSSDQTIRFRQVDAGGAYDWCSYDNIRFGNGKCRIRILGYMPSGTTSLRIRINDAIGGHWIGAQIEDTQWVLGDDTDYDRSGWDTGYSAGAFTCVMQFDGSSLKGRRVGSLSPSLTFDSWDIDHTWSHSIGSNHKPVIAIGSVTPPIDHGYITILEYWNDWS